MSNVYNIMTYFYSLKYMQCLANCFLVASFTGISVKFSAEEIRCVFDDI